MKIQNNTKYIPYILIFIIFVIIRTNHLINEVGIINIEFKSLAVSNCSFPFGILKEATLNDFFLPAYYYLIHFLVVFFKSPILIKIFNVIISFINIILLIDIGKKLLNRGFGYLLGLFFAINHFYLYYSSLICPYCLNFLIGTILIKTILDFLSRPSKKHTHYLVVSNCIFILTNSLAFLYVIPELAILYLIFKQRNTIKKNIMKISYFSFFAFIPVIIILIIQYYNWINLIIPNTTGVGFNLESLFLLVNEYISPYLSFDCPSYQTKTILGMLYSYFLNPSIKHLNSIKLLITFFYSSFLPLLMLFWFTIKSCKKDFKLRILFLIAFANFLLFLFLMMIEAIETHPIFAIQFFITEIILLAYGIYNIKDKLLKYIAVFCLVLIQFINPEVNSFNLTINKNYPTINIFETFLKDYNIEDSDFIIMPYMEQYAKLYYKDLNFFNFDYSLLQKNNKKSMIRNLCNKNTSTINKNNVSLLISDYLKETGFSDYIARYFIRNSEEYLDNRVIVFIDKLNSKPLSNAIVLKTSQMYDYTTKLRKINFKDNIIQQNKTKILFDSISTKTLYNFINLSNINFRLDEIVQYKKVDNDYFIVNNKINDIGQALNTTESDYVFLIYKIYR